MRGEEIECRGFFKCNGREEDCPQWEEGGGGIGCFGVGVEDFGAEGFFLVGGSRGGGGGSADGGVIVGGGCLGALMIVCVHVYLIE